VTSSLFDQMRGLTVAAAAGIGFDQSITVLAQAVPGLDNNFLMQVAEKGGGWVVLLVVLFFYRRDYQRLTTSEKDMRQELIDAITKQAQTAQEVAVALTENNDVMRQMLNDRRLSPRARSNE